MLFCYDGVPIVIFSLGTYLSSCSSFFSFVLFGNCFLDLGVQVPGVGVYDFGNLPVCFIPFGRLSLSNDCSIVFSPLIPPCSFPIP